MPGTLNNLYKQTKISATAVQNMEYYTPPLVNTVVNEKMRINVHAHANHLHFKILKTI